MYKCVSERRSLSDSTCWNGGKKWVKVDFCCMQQTAPPQQRPLMLRGEGYSKINLALKMTRWVNNRNSRQ